MPAPIRTLTDTIAWEQARLGQSRLTQNDWAAGASIDDCALFQSTAVFGQKAAWNVDVFRAIDGGTYHPGKAGLQRGDVVLFDWTGNGIADHTEMALSAPDAAGNFQTIGANGSDTIAVAYRWRNGYVLGYFRPSYLPAATTAATTTPAPIRRRKKMIDIVGIPTGHAKDQDFYVLNIDDHTGWHIASVQQLVWLRALATQAGTLAGYHENQSPEVLTGFLDAHSGTALR